MSKKKQNRFMVSDVNQSIINVFDALCEASGMDRGMAFHCLLIDYFNGFPKGIGLPDNPYYRHWVERHGELQAYYCGD